MYNKTLLEIHTTLSQIKDEYNKQGRRDLESGLSMACLLIKETYYRAIGEGKEGVQENNRAYASIRESAGPTVSPKKEKEGYKHIG